jgi:NAD(P)H-hydrate repair Nnr-like enzyme with NAD(P)H-hydrate dehydratase domain
MALNPTGNPGLASGGTGDVLAGVCGALLAQGWPAWEAAVGAVWMHGAAADRLVEDGVGPIGLTAGELPAAVRKVLNGLVAQALTR